MGPSMSSPRRLSECECECDCAFAGCCHRGAPYRRGKGNVAGPHTAGEWARFRGNHRLRDMIERHLGSSRSRDDDGGMVVGLSPASVARGAGLIKTNVTPFSI